jgi:hypothetical protein
VLYPGTCYIEVSEVPPRKEGDMTRTDDEFKWQGVERSCGHVTSHWLPKYSSEKWEGYQTTVRILSTTPCDECQGDLYRQRLEKEETA